MKVLPKLFSYLMIMALLTGCTMAVNASSRSVQSDAAHWQTWVLASGDALRPAPPPNDAATQTELREVKQLVSSRDETTLQQIAYWDAGSPGYRWLEVTFNQLKSKPLPGPRTQRLIALVNVAIDDATVAAWDAKYTYNRSRPAAFDSSLAVVAQHTNTPSYPSEHAVAAGAASAILAYAYPDDAQFFLDKAQEAAESRVLAGAHFPSDVEAGLELGRQVAEEVIARAAQDDALDPWDGVIPTGNGHWTGEKPVEPTAGKWQTWALVSGDEVRPGPPLAYDSPELAAELQETMNFTRTWQTTQKALYWQTFDGITENWYTFASLRMFEQGLDANAPQAARIYALMSAAHHDAFVACWDAKYTYWFSRPVQRDSTLVTLFPTPNYPSYPSGHACASTAISEVLADQFPASAETIRARATEALESRIWAGIHFRHELVAGKQIGLAVAEKVLAHAAETMQP